ncbi:histidine kinase [Prevotella sp. 10(H)]|uniref:histidine kinase n=1 Tax=Prevotella sp. 10(H) TaxID=1158294 RepID=UPI00068A6BB0|nr:histidine kinase [Prevotella sp. 10(H)]
MNKIQESYKLPSFLTDSKYRIWRHMACIVAGIIITFNQIFVAYQDCQGILGNRIYLICFSSFLMYAAAMYFNYYFLLPRLLLKGKYMAYTIILSAIVFLLPVMSVLQEYLVRNALELPHRITSYTNPLILVDNAALFMITFICFWGASVIVMLRQWTSRNERVSLMEYEHLQSEVNKLKGQITPGFLSKTLTNTSALVKSSPKKTTKMLMKLGQLIRYQLYDCNRDKVLLKSEITFLTNFLDLEKLNRSDFEYTIQANGIFENVFVSPLLFITLVQNMINDSRSLMLTFQIEEYTLNFTCQSDNQKQLMYEDINSIEKRLELLYPEKYTLSAKAGVIELVLNISE